MLKRMNLDEFAREVGNRLETFVNVTRQAQAEGADGFVGDAFEHRTFEDWMAEFDAHEALRVIARDVQQVRQMGAPVKIMRMTDRRRNSSGLRVVSR